MQAINDPEVDLGIRKVNHQYDLQIVLITNRYIVSCTTVNVSAHSFSLLGRFADVQLCVGLAEGHQLCLERGSGYFVRDGALHPVALLEAHKVPL